MKMKASVYTEIDELVIEDREVTKPERGEALVRVHAAGICGSDSSTLPSKHDNIIYHTAQPSEHYHRQSRWVSNLHLSFDVKQ